MESFHVAILGLACIALLSHWLPSFSDSFFAEPRTAGSGERGAGIVPRSAAYRMKGGDNFLLQRLLAASLVIYAHSYALSPRAKRGDDLTDWLGIYSGSVAVYLSFFIDSAPAPTIVLLMSGCFVAAFIVTRFNAGRREATAPPAGRKLMP